MARPIKESVDYFPHFVKSGRTIFILESKHGNDGYAFWFKLLEILGDSEGHYCDCSMPSNWEYLKAKTRCSEDTAIGIIETLLSLGKLDKQLWEERRVIWCQHFVDNISNVYKNRNSKTPVPPGFYEEKPRDAGVSSKENPQEAGFLRKETDIVEYSREKKRIYPYQDIVALWNDICGSCLPKVRTLNDDRRHKIKRRLDEFGGESKEDWLAQAKDLFERIIASDFLRGGNGSDWTATFDWVFENDKNWVKVVEGNYDNNRGARSKQQQLAQQDITLGVGEYIEPLTGRRTYGTGKATIPPTAPARPTERHSWDSASNTWILI